MTYDFAGLWIGHFFGFYAVSATGYYPKASQPASQSERLYLLSKQHTAQGGAALIRGHCKIENSLHWSLDVVMNDGQHRARKDHAPASFVTLRRIVLNIIKANPAKGSNRGKFKKAGWNNGFLKTLIQGF